MRLRFAIVFGLCLTLCLGCTTQQPSHVATGSDVEWHEPAMMVRNDVSQAQPIRVGAGDALGQAIFAKTSVLVRGPRTQPAQIVTADGAIVFPE